MAARKGKFSKNSMVSILFFVIVAIFLILYLKRIDIQKLREVHLSWTFIAVASVFALAGRYWSILVWFVLLKSLGAKNIENHKASLAYVFAKSWMGRYIPGTAPWILGKIYFASKHGISKNKLAVSSLLEGGLQITVTIAISFVMLLLDSRLRIISGGLKLFMLAVLLGCVITIMPPVFNRMVSIAYKIIKKKMILMKAYYYPITADEIFSYLFFSPLLYHLHFMFAKRHVDVFTISACISRSIYIYSMDENKKHRCRKKKKEKSFLYFSLLCPLL